MKRDKFKKTIYHLMMMFFAAGLLTTVSCNDDDDGTDMDDDDEMPGETGEMMTYNLEGVGESTATGMATFAELEDGSVKITLEVEGASNSTHPAHIHNNTAAESGGIAISLTPVDGSTGMSETIVTETDAGAAVTYDDLLNFDGYINVHESEEDLSTLVVQGDIGQNALTGDSKAYALSSVSNPDISGTATFYQRENNEALAVLNLMNTPEGGSHPAHIHMNTAAEGGGIAVSFTPVDGSTGMSKTNIAMTDAGEAITYEDILNYDGYINVHASAEDLATLVAQGDIGQNELTGESMEYDLTSVTDPEISGMATFHQRTNNETLVILSLMNTPEGGSHPAHIHMNTAAEGGDIAFSLTPVDGSTGMSKTNIAMTDGGDAATYEDLLNYDGYINVHASAEDLATLVAQGDIGQNDLTGESMEYDLGPVTNPDISGTATFYQRVNNEALAVLSLMNTPEDGMHPAHIHMNTAAEGGGIAVSFTPVNGSTGMSKTNIAMTDAGDAITYEDILDYDGYINVHASAEDLATLVAQGDIGQNDLTGESETYTLMEKDIPGISGTAMFYQRNNGETLVVMELTGPVTGDHPAHIHEGSVAEAPGGILITLTSVDAMGVSKTNINADDNGNALDYAAMTGIDGYINVHASAADLSTLAAQGDVGANAN